QVMISRGARFSVLPWASAHGFARTEVRSSTLKRAPLFFLLAAPLFAAVDGIVTNQTTGQPQSGATVALYKLGGAGMEAAGQAQTAAQGRFTIAQDVQGPHLVQSVWEGATYNHMLPPGSQTTGLRLDVYNSSRKQPPAAKIAQHMILLEPGNA